MRSIAREAGPALSIAGLFLAVLSFFLPASMSLFGTAMPDWYRWGIFAVGLVLMLVWPTFDSEGFGEFMKTRQARFGGNALVLSLAVLAILGFSNYFATLRYKTWDLTDNKQFSISDKTKQVLLDLKAQGRPVTLTGIFPNVNSGQREFERLGEQYQQVFSGIETEVIVPNLDIVGYQSLISRTEREGLGSRALVAETGTPGESDYKSIDLFSGFDESSITEAIVKLTRPEKTVAFTVGHEEDSIDPDQEGRSYSGIRNTLESEGYRIETLNTVINTDPITAALLVIAAPTKAFSPDETERVSDYLRQGGSVMIMADLRAESGLDSLLAEWGLRLRDDVVLDPEQSLQRIEIPAILGDGYQFHAITEDLVGSDRITIIPGSRSIDIGTTLLEGATVSPLLQTSSAAWGETNFEDSNIKNDAEDSQGPLTVGVAGELAEEQGGGRLVLFSTADIASDALLQMSSSAQIAMAGGLHNGDIALNSINWLGRDDVLIGIEPTPPGSYPLTLPVGPKALLFTLANLCLIPLMIASIGFYIWWSRR